MNNQIMKALKRALADEVRKQNKATRRLANWRMIVAAKARAIAGRSAG
jgi:hypothetical protein